jgi:hypothetical protein
MGVLGIRLTGSSKPPNTIINVIRKRTMNSKVH